MKVGWRSSLSRRDGCFVNPFETGTDWLGARLAGGRTEVEIEGSEDVLMGRRIGRVAVVDVEPDGSADDGPERFSGKLISSCTDVVDNGVPNERPGEKAGAFGLRVVAGAACAEVEILVAGMVALVSKVVSCTLLGNPDGALCKAEKVEDGDSTTPAGGAKNVDPLSLENGGPEADAAVLWSPVPDTTGADVEAPKGEEKAGFVGSPSTEGPVVVLEDPTAEEVVPKPEEEAPNSVEGLQNAEPETKFRLPKTFGVVLRFANADAAGGTMEFWADGAPEAGAGIEDPKAEAAGCMPKTEVDELDPGAASMTDGDGRNPKLSVSHSVALGFSGLG
jgi:hypothetical protein